MLNLSDIKDFFTIERILSKALLKKTISILSMHPYHLGDVLDEKSARFNAASFPETYTQEITLANSNVIILYVSYAINHIPWISL